MSKRTFICLLMAVSVLGLALWCCVDRARPVRGGWGIDGGLTRHTSTLGRFGYTFILENSGIGWLRERDIGVLQVAVAQERLLRPEKLAPWRGDVRDSFRTLRRHGQRITAFATLPVKIKPTHAQNQLPEDLRAVFRQARFLGLEFSELVDAWELVGEPDIGFCTDLPDRVVAYQKALYLGIKAGSKEPGTKSQSKTQDSGFKSQVYDQAPFVLMGALGMPPGPWLVRAAANGLLDYTDAYNFHFYGHARDLTGVIEAHRAAVQQFDKPVREAPGTLATALPMWMTEAGIEAVSKDDFLNPHRRQMQADFTISAAKQALAAADVAVFMPFILVHKGDPYAMTQSPWKTFPAWDAYAKFTRENPWPKRPLVREAREVNSVVMQWLPDNATCVPHKVSGTYRFRGDQPIKGELRIYNFGAAPVKGQIDAMPLRNATASLGGGRQTSDVGRQMSDIAVPAMGMVSVPLEFSPTAEGYFRETWSAAFVEEGGRRSPVSFGLEAWAKLDDFIEEPLPLRSLPDGRIRFPQIEPYAAGEQVGVWTTTNGLKGEAVQKAESGKLKADDENILVSGEASFWIEKVNTDPLAPTMAVAAIDGLRGAQEPAPQLSDKGYLLSGAGTNNAQPITDNLREGREHRFLRLQLDKPMTKDRKVLVVLVDDRGQRYSIWENFGADYYGSRSDIWLNLEDFHADFWGPMSVDYQFRPERIREVQLRFYLDTPNDRVGVRLTLLTAK
jgi:hypothetical protein